MRLLKTGDPLIEVTTSAGLTILATGMTPSVAILVSKLLRLPKLAFSMFSCT